MSSDVRAANCSLSNEIRCFLEFKLNHPNLFKNNILKKFFESSYHIALFGRLICNPSPELEDELDLAFRKFLFCFRFKKYLFSLIKYANIDYHRKRRKYEQRYPLTFDAPVGEDEAQCFGDYLLSLARQADVDDPTFDPNHFQSRLENPELYAIFSELTYKQRVVITLSYSACIMDTEISTLLKVSQQAITKTRHTALKKMRSSLLGAK